MPELPEVGWRRKLAIAFGWRPAFASVYRSRVPSNFGIVALPVGAGRFNRPAGLRSVVALYPALKRWAAFSVGKQSFQATSYRFLFGLRRESLHAAFCEWEFTRVLRFAQDDEVWFLGENSQLKGERWEPKIEN